MQNAFANIWGKRSLQHFISENTTINIHVVKKIKEKITLLKKYVYQCYYKEKATTKFHLVTSNYIS